MSENQMTSRRPRRPSRQEEPVQAPVDSVEDTYEKEGQISSQPPPPPSGKVFLGEEDRRLLKRFDQYVVKKLGISANRSFKI